MSSPYRTLVLVSAVALLGGACSDDVTCIFTTGCQGGSGSISDNEALQPVDGDWIVDGPPEVEDFFPSGTQNPGTTPVVIVFSETIQPDTLDGALEIAEVIGGGITGQPVAGVTQALLADGRVLVLFPPLAPPTGLEAGEYAVSLTELASVLDITGQQLDADSSGRLGTFTVTDNPPEAPRLVMTYPADEAVNQGESTEIVAVFDRRVEEDTVDGSSFDVRVAGVDPPRDPAAEPVLADSGGASQPDTRAFRWRSRGLDGQPASLGLGVEVELRLSPAGNPIADDDDDELAPATITFETLPFAPPLGASLLSDPSDAIGRANLTDGDAEELQVEVEVDAGQPNDAIDLFLFGVQRTTEPDPPLIALQQRTVRLAGTAPILTALFTREIIALQTSAAPEDVRFADGPVTFAFRTRRGSVVTPVRLLDLDPDPDTIQDVLLDTTVPEVTDLFGGDANDTEEFLSEQRGLSLAGQAGDKLRSVDVTTPLDDNGGLPVVGANDAGDFLAAPVPLGLVAGGGTTYSFVARDGALNAAPALAGTFKQLGVIGPTAFTPGDPIEVEVYDAQTLRVLPNARVSVHSDEGNRTDFPFVQAGITLPDGKITVNSAGAPSVGAIVTVELASYDLFTLHGAPSTRLSIPLRRTNQARARASGVVHTTDPAAVALLPSLDRRYDDSRRPSEFPRGFVGAACGGTSELTCDYGPETILDNEPGARSFFAGDFTQTEAAFSVAQLVQAFTLFVPLGPLASNAAPQAAVLAVESLLIDASTPPEEAAQPVPAFTFEVAAGSGVDLLRLAVGAPFAVVDTLIPGLPGAIGVAQGLAYDQGGDRWTIRAGFPGAITAGGSLGSAGVVETDPFVRVEVVDLDGNAAGVRPRLSTLQAAGPSPVFRALAAPRQLAPAPAASTGGQEFTLLLTHAIGDDRTEPGLYRIDLRDVGGRVWTLWRFDPAGSADVQVRVVDVAALGGTGLADGQLQSSVAAFAWSSLAPLDFLWTDVEREFELFSRAAPQTFVKP